MSLCKSLERIARFWSNPLKVHKPIKPLREKKSLEKKNTPFIESYSKFGNISRSEINSHLKNSPPVENKHFI